MGGLLRIAYILLKLTCCLIKWPDCNFLKFLFYLIKEVVYVIGIEMYKNYFIHCNKFLKYCLKYATVVGPLYIEQVPLISVQNQTVAFLLIWMIYGFDIG